MNFVIEVSYFGTSLSVAVILTNSASSYPLCLRQLNEIPNLDHTLETLVSFFRTDNYFDYKAYDICAINSCPEGEELHNSAFAGPSTCT